ncbi:unnamed protein product [Leuciscus chuanchicus]
MKRKSIDQFFQPKKTLKEQESEHVKEQTDRLSEEDVEVDKGTDEDCEVAVEEEMSDSNNKETERELGDVRLSSQEQLDAAKSVFTSTEGYRNWKKASFKDSGFSSHAKSENHQNAMCAWAENKKRQDSNTSLVAIMDEKNKKQLTENQNYVKALAEILIVTATENTAQRGHRETTDSERKGSYVHNKWLKVQKEMFDGAPRELQRLSDTRWACRQAACRNVLDRLPAIIRVLEEIASEMHPQRAVEARGILGQLDLNFVGCLVAFKTILSESKILSDHLQSKNIDFSKAVNLIKAFKDTLDDYRSEDTFGELWNNIVDTCHQSNISTTQNKSKRVRQTTKALQDSIIASTLGQHVSPDGKTSFRDKVYYPVIDHMKGEVERRFSKTNCDIMNGLQALNPSSRSFLGDLLNSMATDAFSSFELINSSALFDKTE